MSFITSTALWTSPYPPAAIFSDTNWAEKAAAECAGCPTAYCCRQGPEIYTPQHSLTLPYPALPSFNPRNRNNKNNLRYFTSEPFFLSFPQFI